MLRSHTCGELTEKANEKRVKLAGWVANKRNHGGVIFIDLRDRYGITQIVFEPSVNEKNAETADKIPRESVIAVSGTVRMRPEGMANEKLVTGQIEVRVDSLEVLSEADVIPIETDDFHEASEEARLKYRFLDLRKPSMQRNIMKKAHVIKVMHDYFTEKGFVNVETPLLMRSTPEGARDFIVPSRLHNGKFYALPQSPQLFKQILMISGFDKYYQIVKCLRDEDLRADRQPEFTQLDLEMSFADEEDVYKVIEELFYKIAKEVFDKEIKVPFNRITYYEAMESYGSDKPDLRYNLKITDVSDIVKGSSFNVFEGVLKSEGAVKALCVKNPGFSRNDIDALIEFAMQNKAKGLAWMRVTDSGLESNIVKFFSEDQQKGIIDAMNATPGDVLLFAADKKPTIYEILDKLRRHLADKLKLYDESEWNFVWVTDFPYFEWNADQKRWDPAHHPFTSIRVEDVEKLDSDKGAVRARAYDITMNGWEIASGSIRIHDAGMQRKMFEALNMSEEEINLKFGWFLDALKYGVPPHGGIAPGLDRLVALMLGLDNIREVIAFPKNKAAINPMDDSPNVVSQEQLKELGIKLDLKEKKEDKDEEENTGQS